MVTDAQWRDPDARDALTGSARYVADLAGPDSYHAVFVRSYLAHGTIMSIDVEGARSAPGVLAVLTAADLDIAPLEEGEVATPHDREMARHALARETVRFVGEPVALVVAEDAASAVDAAEHVWVDIDPLTVVVDVSEALSAETLLFPAAGTNVVIREGETHHDGDEWPVEATVEVENPRLAPSPIEPPAILATPGAGGALEIVCGHQGPHGLRDGIAAALRVEPQSVRVQVPRVGGSFGVKGVLIPEYVIVAAAALQLGRSVMWVATRREFFLAGTHGRAQFDRVTVSGEVSGRVKKVRFEVVGDVGAYPQAGAGLPFNTRFMAVGPYDIDEVETKVTVVVTNTAPVGPYRGAGRPEATYALERAMDAFAHQAGLDPIDVRRCNLIRTTDLPYTTATGATYDSGDYHSALDMALHLLDADGVRHEQLARRERGLDPIGLGLACFVDRSGGGVTSGEYGSVEITRKGEIIARSGAMATGQGHHVMWASIVAEAFGIEPSRVVVITGDTDGIPDGVGTFGSRSVQLAGSALLRTARQAALQVRELAAEMLEASPGDLVLADGAVFVVGVASASVSLGDVADHAAARGVEIRADEHYVPGAMTYSYGVYGAVVEVELEVGDVHIVDLVAVNDGGKIVDLPGALGQIHGATVQGAGQAMLERVSYGDDGQLLTSSLVDYLLPHAIDVPSARIGFLEHPAPSNPLGAKGLGEAGTIGAPPAIVNAAIDALWPYGITALDMPLHSHLVWSAIERARRMS